MLCTHYSHCSATRRSTPALHGLDDAAPLAVGGSTTRVDGCSATEPDSYRVRAGFPIRKKLGRREWLRVRLERDDDGAPVVYKFPRDGAGVLTSMVASDGLVELPEDLTSLEAGTMVDYLPFNEIG